MPTSERESDCIERANTDEPGVLDTGGCTIDYGHLAGRLAKQVLSGDAIHILEYLDVLGTSPATDLCRRIPFAVLAALESAGLVESDGVGSDAVVSITEAGRRALEVDG